MIQVCDPPRQRQVRRLSAEEFFTLVRCGGAGFYRPRTEVNSSILDSIQLAIN